MFKKSLKRKTVLITLAALVVTTFAPQTTFKTLASDTATTTTTTTSTDTYETRFMDLWNELHDSSNGYFSTDGIPYHSIETLLVEAPDYGHVTTSETLSYYMFLEAMYGKFTGNFSTFDTAWNTTETYMIPGALDQPNASMANYSTTKPATYIPEQADPSLYPSALNTSAAVGKDPIHSDLVSTYGTSMIYGMHWMLDVDNWYGYGKRGDGTSTASFINTFQRGREESSFETIPQPCYDDFRFGGTNGYLDLFVGDQAYSKQFKYTNAPDADARAVQATYWANEWAKEKGVDLSTDVAKASKMGDYLRYAMFDKYFRKIGDSATAGTGYDAAHYLMSWYYAWGGGLTANWAWKIGCSHNHFGYQNPMAAWILSENSEFKPLSKSGKTDWATSLDRQIELYKYLQSYDGAIAGGVSNSNNGSYDAWPSGTSTFYGMGYQEHPVYADPGSNHWFGWQTWSMQRVAEYYYKTNDSTVKSLLDKWVTWAKSVVKLNADGTFAIPSNLNWSGQPDTWTGTAKNNTNLRVTVADYGTDLGITASLANTLLYYSKATGDDEARLIAKELLDRMWTLYRDEKGLAASEARADFNRIFDQVVYVPSGFTGTMPNGETIRTGVTFLGLRSKYKTDTNYQYLLACYNAGTAPVLKYHRFWAQCEIAMANGLYSLLFGDNSQDTNSTITPTTAPFDKKTENQADVAVTMTLNGNSLSAIKNGATTLVEGTDYTVSGNTVAILKSYLAAQATDSTVSLTFVFSAGNNAILKIGVTDSSKPSGKVKVQLYNGTTSASTNGINPKFKLYNTGTTDIKLSDIKIRYYYTIDGESGENFWCDWSSLGSSYVTGTFGKLATAVTGADHYFEVGFTSSAATLVAGQSIEVQVRFSKSDWSNYTQTGDYSFSSTNTNYVDNTKATGYISGTLVWGVEP